MVNELQGFLDDKLAALDIVKEEDDATVDENKLEIQDLAICSEWTSHPHCHLTIVFFFDVLGLWDILGLTIGLNPTRTQPWGA